MLQEPVHIDGGEQWARDAALGRAARVAFAPTNALAPVASIPPGAGSEKKLSANQAVGHEYGAKQRLLPAPVSNSAA